MTDKQSSDSNKNGDYLLNDNDKTKNAPLTLKE